MFKGVTTKIRLMRSTLSIITHCLWHALYLLGMITRLMHRGLPQGSILQHHHLSILRIKRKNRSLLSIDWNQYWTMWTFFMEDWQNWSKRFNNFKWKIRGISKALVLSSKNTNPFMSKLCEKNCTSKGKIKNLSKSLK